MTRRWFDCMTNTYHNMKDGVKMSSDVTEKYFKALGWVPKYHPMLGLSHFIDLDGKRYEVPEQLPNIPQSFPDFKKFVLEKMEGEGYKLLCTDTFVIKETQEHWVYSAIWYKFGQKHKIFEPIKDNEILTAAVIAATRYWEGKE